MAGDNYRVEASFDSSFRCDKSCASSGVFTAWKRVYFEVDEMFRNGAFLKQTAAAGQNRVVLFKTGTFAKGQWIRLIHAPRYDGNGSQDFYFEDKFIGNVASSLSEYTLTFVDLANPKVPSNLLHSYGTDSSVPGVNYLNDAVGQISAEGAPATAQHSYRSNLTAAIPLFASMFVDIATAPDPVPAVPFIPNIVAEGQVAMKWLHNAVAGTAPNKTAKANHRQLIVGSRLNSDLTNGQYYTGLTRDAFSYVFYRRIEELLALKYLAIGVPNPVYVAQANQRPGAANVVSSETTAHEMVHEWGVNMSGYPAGGHCNRDMASFASSIPAGLKCSLREPGDVGAERLDGYVGLHWLSQEDSEYMFVRRREDPLPLTPTQ